MKKLVSLLLMSLFFIAVPLHAAPANYWSVGGGFMTFDDSVDKIKPIQLFGRVGHDFTENFGVGLEAGFSLVEDELDAVDYSVTSTFLYVKGSLPVGEGSKLYAMIGPTNVELSGEMGGVTVSVDDDDTGIGFGFEKILGAYSVTADYILYNDNDGADVSAINIGFVGYF
ncbi:MAG: porin family protein [Gammaproteobacteria bacterium]|nr:porin family protein [Gammaproteobacteria bacterium]